MSLGEYACAIIWFKVFWGRKVGFWQPWIKNSNDIPVFIILRWVRLFGMSSARLSTYLDFIKIPPCLLIKDCSLIIVYRVGVVEEIQPNRISYLR